MASAAVARLTTTRVHEAQLPSTHECCFRCHGRLRFGIQGSRWCFFPSWRSTSADMRRLPLDTSILKDVTPRANKREWQDELAPRPNVGPLRVREALRSYGRSGAR